MPARGDPRREHFDHLLGLLEQEGRAQAERARALSDRLTPQDAERAGISLVELIILEEAPGLGGLLELRLAKKNRSLPLPWTRIGTGDPVLLRSDEPGAELIRAVVSFRNQERISVLLRGEGALELDLDATYRLDLSSDEVTLERQRRALRLARDAKGTRLAELVRVFAGELAPAFDPEPELPPDLALDPTQAAAVRHALAAKDVALIHGPPGTGKTSTLAALIAAAVSRGERVLATAPSNLAVDNLLERLLSPRLKVVRLGHPARILPELVEHALSVQVERHEDVRLARGLIREALALRRKAGKHSRARPAPGARAALYAEARALFRDARQLEARAVDRILDGADVVLCTTSIDPDLLGQRTFDLVIVDEACQSTEPGSWPPLRHAGRVVLAGDHRQLSATVISRAAATGGLGISLFERAIDRYGPAIARRLDIQYRMHEAIMRFPSEELYEGTLVAAPAVRAHRLSDLSGVEATALTTEPLCFLDTAGAGFQEALEPDGESRLNSEEAKLVARVVQRLIDAGVPGESIGVITPYAAQARHIRGQLPRPEVEVDTVDGFQGREKEAVVISLVRSNDDGELGFLGDIRRMNVALTRARRKLVVIGDGATLAAHPFYLRFMEAMAAQGAHGTVWDPAWVT